MYVIRKYDGLNYVRFSGFTKVAFVSFFAVSGDQYPLSIFGGADRRPLSSRLGFTSIFSCPRGSTVIVSLNHLVLMG